MIVQATKLFQANDSNIPQLQQKLFGLISLFNTNNNSTNNSNNILPDANSSEQETNNSSSGTSNEVVPRGKKKRKYLAAQDFHEQLVKSGQIVNYYNTTSANSPMIDLSIGYLLEHPISIEIDTTVLMYLNEDHYIEKIEIRDHGLTAAGKYYHHNNPHQQISLATFLDC